MSEEKKNKYPNPDPIYGDYGSKLRHQYLMSEEYQKVRKDIPERYRVRWWQGWIFYESEIEDAERQARLLYERIEDMREHYADPIKISIKEQWLRGAKHRFDTYRRRREVWNRVRWVLTFIVGVIIAFSSLVSLFRDGCW